MGLKSSRAPAVLAIALVCSACGTGQSTRAATTTRPPAAASLPQVVDAGRLTFRLPTSWKVGYGTCRCGWGEPDTATLDNGPQEGGVACSCPLEPSDAPSGLHLYEGQSGLVYGGMSTMINGLHVMVGLDTTTATLTATFPDLDQWLTISPAPPSESASDTMEQVALEKQILSTVSAAPPSGTTP